MQLNSDSDGDNFGKTTSDFDSDKVVAGGRLGRLRKQRAGNQVDETLMGPTIDKEMLGKDIVTLMSELHDAAMNFKEVS